MVKAGLVVTALMFTQPALALEPPALPSSEAALGQTVVLAGSRLTPLAVLRDDRAGCVPPPGVEPQRACVAIGRLVLRLRIVDHGRARIVRLDEFRPVALAGGALSMVGYPSRPPADRSAYRFSFTWNPAGPVPN